MLHCQMARKVVREVVGIAARVRGTHRTDDLLTSARVPVLLGDVVSQLGLGETQLGTERAGVGERGLHTVALTSIEQVYTTCA